MGGGGCVYAWLTHTIFLIPCNIYMLFWFFGREIIVDLFGGLILYMHFFWGGRGGMMFLLVVKNLLLPSFILVMDENHMELCWTLSS